MLEGLSVFVSHSSEDDIWCRDFVQELRQSGANVWYDEHNLAPTILLSALANEITKRPIFVVILSPDAVMSKYVNLEINIAVSLQVEEPNRVVLPVEATEASVPSLLRIFTRITGQYGGGLSSLEAARRVIDALSVNKLGEERRAALETANGVSSSARTQYTRGYIEGWLAALNNIYDLLRHQGLHRMEEAYELLADFAFEQLQDWQNNQSGEIDDPPMPPPFSR